MTAVLSAAYAAATMLIIIPSPIDREESVATDDLDPADASLQFLI